MLRALVVGVCVVVLASGCQAPVSSERGPLEGTWKVKSITYITSRGEFPIEEALPGLFIFGEEYYSMVWMPMEAPLEDFAETWRPTDEEKVRSWNSIVVNSGTYTYTDSTVTTHPLVAKTPEFVGGSAVYTYRVEGDTLFMEVIDTVSHTGVQDPGIGLVRIPTTLVRVE